MQRVVVTSLKSWRLKEEKPPALMYNGNRARHMMIINDFASYDDKLYQLQSYAAYAIFVLWKNYIIFSFLTFFLFNFKTCSFKFVFDYLID